MSRPRAYTACNGFVRSEYGGGAPSCPPNYWPSSSHSSVLCTNAYHLNHAHYVRPCISWSAPSGSAWGNIPIYPQERSSDRSRKSANKASCNFPPFSGSTRQPAVSTNGFQPRSLGLTKSAQYPSDIVLHKELQWHHTWTLSSSGLVWDVARPPSAAKAITQRFAIVIPDFKAPVMHKGIEHFEVWTDHPVLDFFMRSLKWGSIPMPKKNPSILDFLQAIYEYLSTPLTSDDLKFILSTPQNSHLLERARQERVKDGFDAIYAAAVQGPFRRSDVLGGHRRFQGARVARMGDGTDRLYFNLGRGPIPRI